MAVHEDMVRMARMQTFQDKVPALFERARNASTSNDKRNLARILKRIVEKSSAAFLESLTKAESHTNPSTRMDLIARAHMEHFNAVHGCYRVACVGRAISARQRSDMFEMTYSIEWSLYMRTIAERPGQEYMPVSTVERLLNIAQQFNMMHVKASIFEWQCRCGHACMVDDRTSQDAAIEALYQPLPSEETST